MSSWGTALASNDTYADVYAEFFEYYNAGEDVAIITQKLVATYQEIINDPNDCTNFLFALAQAQWECKQLDPQLFAFVKRIITSGQDLNVWQELGESADALKKRKKALEAFLLQLSQERPTAKRRVKKRVKQPLFAKGDCLTFQLEGGVYGGAIVLAAQTDEYGLNGVALTRINQSTKPTVEDFLHAHILVTSYGDWRNTPQISWYFCDYLKKEQDAIEVVGNIEVLQDFDAKSSFSRSFIEGANIMLTAQIEFEKSHDAALVKTLTVEELLRRGKFWSNSL